MNRKEFDKLTVDEQVIYINKQSQLGISMRGSAKKIGIPHSTLQERFKVKGYSFNVAARQYMKDDDKVMTSVTSSEIAVAKADDECQTTVSKVDDDNCHQCG